MSTAAETMWRETADASGAQPPRPAIGLMVIDGRQCSFCDNHEHQGVIMAWRDNVVICEDCIVMAAKAIQDERIWRRAK